MLVTHYQSEHKVEFYASRLHVSTHYLTSVVKSVTRQSVSDFIFEMLYSEARILLTHSRLSIQEIAMKLNFSDQSAFGKFFKRRNGSSPLEFRRLYGKRGRGSK
ncbi:MAG: AraC family transcriptional regulator [Bacteroides sp.]|nr:AraC family transcriptional regulator [Bacteroides sp.]